MYKKNTFNKLLISLGIPLFIGSISGFLSGNSILSYQQLEQPPLSPPGWIFPIVWTILFLLMGFASYLVYTADDSPEQIKSALTLYLLQLIVNFFWSIIFFGGEFYLFAFLWLLLLLILIILTMVAFYKMSKLATWLMIPYLLWVIFAGYLNLFIYFLN